MPYTPTIHKLESAIKFNCQCEHGLVLRSTNWLGDALMTLPAAWQLSRLVKPGGNFAVLCPRFLAPLWKSAPWVTDVIEMQGSRISKKETASVRALSADAGIIFPNSFGSALDIWKCGLPRRIGRRGRWRGLFLTDKIREWPRTGKAGEFHQLSWYLELVDSLTPAEWSADYPALKINTSEAISAGMTENENWLLVAPGAAYGPAKQWPLEYYAEVARRWIGNGGKVVAIGSGKEAPMTKELADKCPGVLDVGGKTSLSQLMAICRMSKSAVCNDSGAMHLAAACGTPGVAVFGSTDPVATGPLGAPWELIVSDANCRPCFKRTCTDANPYHCLRGITVDTVWSKLCTLT